MLSPGFFFLVTWLTATLLFQIEGKLDKSLKKFLKKNIVDKDIQETLIVSDAKVIAVEKHTHKPYSISLILIAINLVAT